VIAASSTRCSCNDFPQQEQAGSGSRTSIGGAVHWSGVGRARKVKCPRPGLRPRAFGLGLALPLGERGGLPLGVPRESIELGPQGGVLRQEFLDPRLQCGEFREQRGDFSEGRHEAYR